MKAESLNLNLMKNNQEIDGLYADLEDDTDPAVIEASKRKLGQLEAVLEIRKQSILWFAISSITTK